MKVVSWNVNGIRARLDAVVRFIGVHEPDVLCLQETKVRDDDFPTEELGRLGYALAVSGQPGYNGVAIASRLPLADSTRGLGDDASDAEKRAIAATIAGVRVVNVYVPNGKDVTLPSFLHKLRWLERLRMTLDTGAQPEQRLVLAGDFNVARDDRDVYDPERFRGRLHFHPDEHRALERVLAFGLVDAFRRFHDGPGLYSWWDYRGGDLRANRGLRIDYLFVTEPVASRLLRAEIDTTPRHWPSPSDHAPVLIEFST